MYIVCGSTQTLVGCPVSTMNKLSPTVHWPHQTNLTSCIWSGWPEGWSRTRVLEVHHGSVCRERGRGSSPATTWHWERCWRCERPEQLGINCSWMCLVMWPRLCSKPELPEWVKTHFWSTAVKHSWKLKQRKRQVEFSVWISSSRWSIGLYERLLETACSSLCSPAFVQIHSRTMDAFHGRCKEKYFCKCNTIFLFIVQCQL